MENTIVAEDDTNVEDNIIEVQDVNFAYNKGKDNAFQALYNINLKIKRNNFVIIFGPSGCGKSSLLNIISGLEFPDEGDVLVEGSSRRKMTKKDQVEFHRETIGMIFQSYNLIPTLNVLDNVVIPQIFINKRKKERETKGLSLLKRFGIEEYAKRIPTELSGGEQQRIGIARTLINDQPIILADEPVGNLDSKSANNVMHILNKLNKEEGKTIIMVSHNPENTIWGDHIIYMKDGKVEKEDFRDKRGDILEIKNIKRSQDITEFETLLRNFQGLTREQIRIMIAPMKAEILTREVIFKMDERQIKRLEDGIRQRLLGTINSIEFFERLDKSEEKGGIELNARTAQKIVNDVEEIMKVARVTTDKNQFSDEEIASVIMRHIAARSGATIHPNKLNDLRRLIKNRLNNEIDRKDFANLLDRRIEDGGAGLNRQTAKKIAKQVDLILMISYGMSQIQN